MPATAGSRGSSGPCGLRVFTTRRRPQLHADFKVGRVADQAVRAYGSPVPVAGSGSQTRPHREQGRARDLATQLRHSRPPLIGRCSLMTRPHSGHGGRMILVAPASQSLPIRRSTDGTGVSAPAPVTGRAGPAASRPAGGVSGLGGRGFHRRGDGPGRRRIECRDDLITVSTGSGRGPPRARPHFLHRGCPPGPANAHVQCCRGAWRRAAGSGRRAAVPVLAAALLASAGLAALGAYRGRDRRRYRLDQRDEQVPYHSRGAVTGRR